MSSPGYSGKPLSTKLGLKPDSRYDVRHGPGPIGDLPSPNAPVGPVDVLIAFFTSRADFERELPGLSERIYPDGGLWIAWPKKASRAPTDIVEQTIRDVALPMGLVDNKVCAVDDIWSGLRLVWRKELRGQRSE